MQNFVKESMRLKGPCGLPFIRRAAIILRFRDMASESKGRDRKRGENNHRKAENIKA